MDPECQGALSVGPLLTHFDKAKAAFPRVGNSGDSQPCQSSLTAQTGVSPERRHTAGTEFSTQRRVDLTLFGALEAFETLGRNVDTQLCSLSWGVSKPTHSLPRLLSWFRNGSRL